MHLELFGVRQRAGGRTTKIRKSRDPHDCCPFCHLHLSEALRPSEKLWARRGAGSASNRLPRDFVAVSATGIWLSRDVASARASSCVDDGVRESASRRRPRSPPQPAPLDAVARLVQPTSAKLLHIVCGTFNSAALYMLAFDPIARSLVIASRTLAQGPHQYLATNPARDRVYATTWAQPPTLSSWAVDLSDRSLSLVNTVPISASARLGMC